MATALTVQTLKSPFAVIGAGDLDYTLAAADVAGNTFVCTGRELLLFQNSDAGAVTVTITSVDDEKGRSEDITSYSMAAGDFAVFGVGLTNSKGWKSTAGTIRKLRDGAGGTTGAVMWVPSPTKGLVVGQPDLLNGYPVYTDPNVASIASTKKVVFFGDWNAYYFRTVGDLMVERNDSVGFATDEVFFRGKWRAAGGAQDLTAINLMKQSVS
jgi:hypothetical protein